eukprot:4471235-Heterocapsa_arctica.AAC.1
MPETTAPRWARGINLLTAHTASQNWRTRASATPPPSSVLSAAATQTSLTCSMRSPGGWPDVGAARSLTPDEAVGSRPGGGSLDSAQGRPEWCTDAWVKI